MKTSDLFVKALENEGVEYIYGIPGEENLDFLNSLKNSPIKLILTRHEQTAGFMAATYGRLTGKPGVCLSTLGPGATNFVTAAAYAQLGAMPMIMLGGQKPIRTSNQGRFQLVDVVGLMKPITKYSEQISDGSNVSCVIRDTFRICSEERPGAAYIELPEDIAQTDTNTTVFDVIDYQLPQATDESLNKAVKMIQEANMPLLLIGAGANRKHSTKALTDFINKTGIYFFNTQMGKGVIDERHPQCLGTAALSKDDFLHCAIDRADLIVNVGHDIIEKPPFLMKKGGTKVIHINTCSARNDEVYFPQQVIVGDINYSVEQLTRRLNTLCQNSDYFRRVKDYVSEKIAKYADDERFPMLPQRLVKILRETLDDADIITLDNGIYKIWFARNYPCYSNNTLLLDNALATMGAGLPSALVAKQLNPTKKVISVNGDGGFMMNSQELETAVRMNLNLVVIILNDSAYGMIKWKQEGKGFDDYGLDFNNPDFVAYANSFGAIGHRPIDHNDFLNILSNALNSSGVHVIDLPIDYSMNHQILNIITKESQCII
ncbi:acetolactate synthase large subunit [Parashewanella spongiae]|uniref:Acetolactate synthase large subunit n=1 Tax=Parashewanella spongiae TaxID=342950 RepID=A0A3A6TC46_9GAMM|nr:acetolactate synthase large subunit [Parashewanella spongiae]MCL1079569.1 acetolactate synthase large subunit [Parashewanella spongiae]RJY07292.1 acetolactate synthase large subunit [Parashewanella spongiae]